IRTRTSSSRSVLLWPNVARASPHPLTPTTPANIPPPASCPLLRDSSRYQSPPQDGRGGPPRPPFVLARSPPLRRAATKGRPLQLRPFLVLFEILDSATLNLYYHITLMAER